MEKEDVTASFGFSDRETDVLKLLVEGRTNVEIAENLHISVNTVKSHIKSLYKKSEVTSRIQLLHKIRQSL